METVKNEASLSDKLQNLILHPQDLAVNLANKEYNNYKPIDIRYLFKEAYSGTMLKEDFRQLVIQDFFKSISKIYKNSTPLLRSWKKPFRCTWNTNGLLILFIQEVKL